MRVETVNASLRAFTKDTSLPVMSTACTQLLCKKMTCLPDHTEQ